MHPPKLAGWLLKLVPQPDREFIEGDLEEEYATRLALGRAQADAWYWEQVLATLPWFGLQALKRLNHAITTTELHWRHFAMASPTGGPVPAAIPRTPAFGSRLLASKPPRAHGTFVTGVMSMVFHVGTLGSLVYSTIGEKVETVADEVKVIEVTRHLEETKTPPPPPETDAAPPEIDLSSLTPPTVIPPDIPPPGKYGIDPDSLYQAMIREAQDTTDDGKTGMVEIGADPPFTPFEVAPEVKNRDEVGRALEREYPALLRDAGVGGKVEVWFHVDEQGTLLEARVNTSSGQPSLDDAALRVARIVEFRPAMNRDKPVPVWVSIPITFQVR